MRLKKEEKITSKMAVVTVVILLLYIVLCIWAVNDIQKSFHDERTEKTHMLMGKIAQNIETAVESKWDTLHQFVSVFDNHKNEVTSLEDVISELTRVKDTFTKDIDYIALVDTNSVGYCINGEKHKWNKYELLASGEDECYISDTENCASNESLPHIFFLSPLKEEVTVEGITFTHMVISVEMSVYDKYFDTTEFGEDSMCYILRNTGGQVYKQEKDNSLSGVLNVVSALSRSNFHYGASAERMKEEIRNGVGNCVSLTYEGVSYDVAYEPLIMNGWAALLMVPTDTVAFGTKTFMSSIIYMTLIMAAATFSVVIYVLIWVTRRVNMQFQKVAEAEKRANAAKTNFLSAMSHDIRTPMNAIVGMTRLALERSDDEEYVRNCLCKVKVASDHLLTLINDVLDISKVESGRMILNPVDISLKEEAQHVVSIIAPQINEKEQQFEFHTEEMEWEWAHIDQLRLNQIMMNLLSNAMKYTPVGGSIRVDLKSRIIDHGRKRMLFTYIVKDTGMGMSEEFQKIMYTSFSRENDTPQRSIQGSGLGLAICKQMVELMGGTIECDSEPGRGTTFTVNLELPAAEAETAPKEAGAFGSVEDLEGLKILVAEDNDFNWEVASEILRMQGVIAERAENGQICIDKMNDSEAEDYDLILMDVQMPVKNGYEATIELRSSERKYLREIPIIAMTADAFAEDVQKCIEVGMNAHISKPVDVDKLLEIIKNFRGGGTEFAKNSDKTLTHPDENKTGERRDGEL